MIIEHPLLFSTERYTPLAKKVAEEGRFQTGEVELQRFPDGELYQRIVSDVRGRHVALLGGTVAEADTLELYDLACALVKYGVQSLTLVIPYFGYSTMERAIRPGEVVKAKTRARLISSIPTADAGNRVILLDLHSEGLPHYFEGGIKPVHVYCKKIVKRAAKALAGDDFVLACTDAGRAKWVESLANDLGVHAAFIFKRRIDGAHTEVAAVSAPVQGQNVVIYDDMIRTGGSLIGAAKAYKQAGAGKIWAICTHGIFPGESLSRIQSSGLFESIVATDSHPRVNELAGDFLKVESVSPLLVHAIIDDLRRGEEAVV